VDPSSGGGKFDLYPNKITIATALNTQLLEEELKKMLLEKKFNAISFNSSRLSADTLKKLEALKEELAHFIPVIEIVQSKFTWSVASEQQQFPIIQLQDSVYQQDSHYTIHIDAIELSNFTSKNVIAFLPGKNKKLAPFVFTAHYDHLGRMGSETYFPGANDNASGVAMLLELARYFKANKTERSIYFIAFACEEAGLLGSKHFVEHPLFPLKNIGFLMNVDIMGSGEDGVTIVNATLFEKAFKQLVEINDAAQLLKVIKSRGPAANSDHYWFTKAGVPAFFMYTMGPNKNYHDIFDRYEALSFNEFEDIKKLLIQFCQSYN
jgi:Iap family predicted aminopeptidase